MATKVYRNEKGMKFGPYESELEFLEDLLTRVGISFKKNDKSGHFTAVWSEREIKLENQIQLLETFLNLTEGMKFSGKYAEKDFHQHWLATISALWDKGEKNYAFTREQLIKYIKEQKQIQVRLSRFKI